MACSHPTICKQPNHLRQTYQEILNLLGTMLQYTKAEPPRSSCFELSVQTVNLLLVRVQLPENINVCTEDCLRIVMRYFIGIKHIMASVMERYVSTIAPPLPPPTSPPSLPPPPPPLLTY